MHKTCPCCVRQGCRPGGGGWGSFSPPMFDRSVNPISTGGGGQIMPTTILPAPPDVQTLRRTCQINWCCSRLSHSTSFLFWSWWGFFCLHCIFVSGKNSTLLNNILRNFQVGTLLQISMLIRKRRVRCMRMQNGFSPIVSLTTGFWGKEAWRPTPKWNTRFFFAFSKRTQLWLP